MSDINLLPEDLRDKPTPPKSPSGAGGPVEFTAPGKPAGASAGAVSPGTGPRWQRLLTALRSNLSVPKSAPVAPVKPPAAAAAPTMAKASAARSGEADSPVLTTGRPATLPASSPRPARPPQSPSSSVGEPPPAITGLPEVNLIPADERDRVPRRQFALTGLAALVALVVIVVIGLVFMGLGRQREAELEGAQAELVAAQQELEQARAAAEGSLAANQRLAAIRDELENHASWLPVFTLLEQRTLVTVYFVTLAGDVSGKLTLSGFAPSYTDVARQLKSLQSAPGVRTAAVDGLKLESPAGGVGGGVGFTLSLELDPAVFHSLGI